MTLGVRRGKLAAGIAGTGHQSSADIGRLDRQAKFFDRHGRQRKIIVAHARDQQVLPDRQPNLAITEIVGDFCQAAHLLAGHLAHRQYDTNPVQTCLLLLVHADMGHPVKPRTGRNRSRWSAYQFAAKLIFDRDEELFDPHAVEHVFEARLQPVSAIAGFDEHADNGVGYLGRVRRLDDDVGFLGEILMAGDAAYA